MNFNIGEKVRIKEGFQTIKVNGSVGYNKNMVSMAGNEYTVDNKRMDSFGNYRYVLADNRWIWMEQWLEPANEFDDIEEDDIFTFFKEE